nr:hypothetical protein [Pandoravirus aubagnensis]
MEHRAEPFMSDLTRRRIVSTHTRAPTDTASTRDQIDQLTLLVLRARDHGTPLDDAFHDNARHQLGLAHDSFARLLCDALDDIQRQVAEERRIQQELEDRLGSADSSRSMSFWAFLLSCCGTRR